MINIDINKVAKYNKRRGSKTLQSPVLPKKQRTLWEGIVFNNNDNNKHSFDKDIKKTIDEKEYVFINNENLNNDDKNLKRDMNWLERNVIFPKTKYIGFDHLTAACADGNLNQVKHLVKCFGHQINNRDKANLTPLETACLTEHTEIAVFLIEHCKAEMTDIASQTIQKLQHQENKENKENKEQKQKLMEQVLMEATGNTEVQTAVLTARVIYQGYSSHNVPKDIRQAKQIRNKILHLTSQDDFVLSACHITIDNVGPSAFRRFWS